MNIIINADDFGLSEKVNLSILNLHKIGVVTSTTLMSKGEQFNMAVKMVKDNPQLGVGVHLCLDGPFNVGKDYMTLLDKKHK
ncbi:MAG: ChbG/HpnK family deacetylase [Bacteroidales bacterium]|nr:ChbG/HpnK family deacetylase [Bacteroidales bacterium]